jgi:hypothetical protein
MIRLIALNMTQCYSLKGIIGICQDPSTDLERIGSTTGVSARGTTQSEYCSKIHLQGVAAAANCSLSVLQPAQ